MSVFGSVNFLAVLAATISMMVVGFIWYAPSVFGNAWMKLVHLDKKKMEKGMQQGMVIGFLSALLKSYVLALIFLIFGFVSIADAITFAIILWAGFTLPVMLDGVAWEQRPWKLLHINAAGSLVSIVVAALVLMWWPI